MSSLAEIRTAIQRARAELAGAIQPEALRAAADAAALVENRIVETGRTADGGRLTPYSDAPAPAFFYLGRSRTSAGEGRVRAKVKKREPISYREFRQLNGLNTSHKTLEFTGEMWRGFGITAVRPIAPGLVEVEIGGQNPRTRTLLGYHSERERTDITKPSRQELRQIEAAMAERLKNIIERYV